MRTNSELASYVTEHLAFLGRISNRGIFGGIGIFIDERLLGIVIDEVLYLHTDDANREDYVSRGMPQFKPYPNAFDLTTDHHQVPEDIVHDPQRLKEWGERALKAAIESARAKQRAGIERARRARIAKSKNKSGARASREVTAEDLARLPKRVPGRRVPKARAKRADFLAREIEALLVDVHGKKKDRDSEGGDSGSSA
ncbi:MAG: hypothetical protein DIU71_09065 [Proteobacteria bacterium]|nr:MAG: hypothetical protein DIU71_09065 [Pseudomonadota bacterium]